MSGREHAGVRDQGPVRAWPELLTALLQRRDLSAEDTAWAMDRIMLGEATPAQISAFLVALRAKGETVAEVSGLVRAMYRHATVIDVPGPAVDIVGTGGDRAKTVNISTMSAVVVAGTGVRVVKHGNRAASSASGAADVLGALGVNLDLSPERVAEVAEEAGITFCFAQKFHPAMRHAAPPRRELGIPTAFNILGPLTNPARVGAQATGVADARLAPVVAGVLAERGVSALVFRGDDGLDELTITTTSRVWVVRDGAVREETVDPTALGIERVGIEALRGADAEYNAEVVRKLLAGKTGPVRDAVLLNAAAALVAAGPEEDAPLQERLAAGMRRAAEAIDSGAAQAVLERWAAATQR
ncbi:anthranilate phosphoribosyltransferase [Allostreptomyces psammosilenae]|uniref:Anthranilate phosphoribosyltransferase n=1 Tax=Allostreptomyces psammosilenae TaxID=1892865 RepID=A0A852ZXX0_9ACTN|nr:anthranilate phosphoribosyltransferase [Allostreptomyces psammosilenae]NYI07029.1 anthranilate phosphoribosyltransferase [Allostreptomyces psammosilenae]